jgi:2'-5' RNA ligase
MGMNGLFTSPPGYRVYDYLLVITPPEVLWNRLMKVKEDFSIAYKTDAAKWSKPYITLVAFSQQAMWEERIINRLQNLTMAYAPFIITLKDFGSFPSHTIYINITSKLAVQNLVKNIRTETQRLMQLNEDKKPHFIMEPHITIGRKLKPWQYEKGWLEYRNSHFSARFMATDITLLKRPSIEAMQENKTKYQPATAFAFQNLPVVTKQGVLF